MVAKEEYTAVDRKIDMIFLGKYTRAYGVEDNSERVFGLIQQDIHQFVAEEIAIARQEVKIAAAKIVDEAYLGPMTDAVTAKDEIIEKIAAL